MNRMKYLFTGLIAMALLAGMADPGYATIKDNVMAEGNNVGLHIMLYDGPMNAEKCFSQFPKGSGNLFKAKNWGWYTAVARDLDGDGTADDTTQVTGRGFHFNPQRPGTLEMCDEIEAMWNANGRVDQGVSSNTNMQRVYSSLDKEDLADWPIEFRQGRTAAGAPVLHGAETVCMRASDAWMASATFPPQQGTSVEYRFHFLNFGPSNNMVFSHVFFRNMSEYLKWSPKAEWRDLVSATPDGQLWNGLCFIHSRTNMQIGNKRDEGFIYHPALQVVGAVDRNGIESGFTGGGNAFIIAEKVLRYPSFGGETASLTNINTNSYGSNQFGINCDEDLYASGKDAHLGYRAALGTENFCQSEINPWTGRVSSGVPGVLTADDDRYEQWIWGSYSNQMYSMVSELHDFAPRDTTSLDYVMMFVYPKNPPLILPQPLIANIDDPMIQEQLETVEEYAELAQLVYDGGYILPETPEPPPLTIIPGDRQVTVTWSDINTKTPDAYYAFLQQHGLDPEERYLEYDFEGYRLYRSFVGPGDSHSELLGDWSISAGNLQYYYSDRHSDDQMRRMRNGMKIWYALVPYDRNYDVESGEAFSLPLETSGKKWNRPGENLYTVIPRSNASEFRGASLASQNAVYEGQAPLELPSVQLAGDGTGKLTEAPKWLAPVISNTTFTVVNDEKLTSDKTIFLQCTGMGITYGGCNYPTGLRTIQIIDGAENGVPIENLRVKERSEPRTDTYTFNGPVNDDGIVYAISADFESLHQGSFREDLYYSIDIGGYTGAEDVDIASHRCSGRRKGGTAPSVLGWARNARVTLSWKDAGDGNLTLDASNETTGEAIAFGPFYDDFGWGFIHDMEWGTSHKNGLYGEMKSSPDKAGRSLRMVETYPADNTTDFGIWVNGAVWRFQGGDSGLTMPLPGTVMTIDFCLGKWNSDMTSFTQYAESSFPGDKWRFDITAMSMNPDDADLSKIRVVPNPYLASSTLDLSSNSRRIEFVNLPANCTIRIYSLGGKLVNVLNHIGSDRYGWGDYTDRDRMRPDNTPTELTGYDNHSGTEPWNLRNRFGQTVASGLYFFHVTDSRGEQHTGRFYVIN